MYVFVTKRKFLLLRQVSFGATPKLGISTSTAENLFVDPKGFEVGSPSFPTQLMRVALTTVPVPHSRTYMYVFVTIASARGQWGCGGTRGRASLAGASASGALPLAVALALKY